MNKFSKVIFVAALLLVSVITKAQFRFGPQVGLNIANANAKGDGVPATTSKIGLNIGAIAEYSLSESMALQSGLIYSQKGFKAEMNLFVADVKISESLSYLEIPVNFKYFFPVGAAKIFGAAGPYAAFAIGGTEEVEASMAFGGFVDMSEFGFSNGSRDLKIGSGVNDQILGADFGLNIGAGVEIKNFVVSAQYGLGLVDIEANPTNGSSTKIRTLSLSVAYLFGGK